MGAFDSELYDLNFGIKSVRKINETDKKTIKVDSPNVGGEYFSYMDNGKLVSVTVLGIFEELVIIRTSEPQKCFSGMKSEFAYPIRNYNFYLIDQVNKTE